MWVSSKAGLRPALSVLSSAGGSWQEARILVLFIGLDSGLKKPYLAWNH